LPRVGFFATYQTDYYPVLLLARPPPSVKESRRAISSSSSLEFEKSFPPNSDSRWRHHFRSLRSVQFPVDALRLGFGEPIAGLNPGRIKHLVRRAIFLGRESLRSA